MALRRDIRQADSHRPNAREGQASLSGSSLQSFVSPETRIPNRTACPRLPRRNREALESACLVCTGVDAEAVPSEAVRTEGWHSPERLNTHSMLSSPARADRSPVGTVD